MFLCFVIWRIPWFYTLIYITKVSHIKKLKNKKELKKLKPYVLWLKLQQKNSNKEAIGFNF